MHSLTLQKLHSSSDCRPFEIVFSVYNEQDRVRNLIDSHVGTFKLVFLDGGSTDNTHSIIISADCDLFLRPDFRSFPPFSDKLSQAIFTAQNGTSYFVAEYINKYSKASFCLFMWADEYIEPCTQLSIVEYFLSNQLNINAVRIDWVYGSLFGSVATYQFSFRPGEACWDSKRLHSDVIPLLHSKSLVSFPVQHFSDTSISGTTGKLGNYTYAEVIRLCGKSRSYLPIFRRYGLQILIPFKRLLRYRSPFHFFIALLLILFDCILGHITYFEIYFLPSLTEQRRQFAKYRRLTSGHLE